MTRVAAGFSPGILYGLLAFLAGLALGPVRELVLAPRYGGLPSAVMEALALALLLWLAARIATAWLPARADWAARAGMALAALLIVLLFDMALAVALEVLGYAAQRAPRTVLEHLLFVPLLLWEAALPFLLRRG